MDDIDKKLIALLAENARTPLNQLSQQVFLTSPAVAARIEKLEEKGIITGYKAAIDPGKLGNPILSFIQLTLPPEQKAEFSSFIRDCTNVLECYHITGAYSMILKVCFPTPASLDTFVTSLQKFGKTQTQIVFSTVVEPRSCI